jgi:cbb3-type cytochrome oxidase cytochrome c subunit
VRIFVGAACLLALVLAGLWGCSRPQKPPRLELAVRLGCFACHSLGRQGGELAAPLDRVGARLSPQKLQIALTCPRRLYPHARMPSYAYLPPVEQKTLLNYLESLQ